MPRVDRGKTPYQRELEKMQRAMMAREQAVTDFNIMIGNLEDPSEGEEDEEPEI